VCPSAYPDPLRQQETPATGGGRLRASGSSAAGEGRGDNSHALELRDNANLPQEFQHLVCWARLSARMCKEIAEPNFALGNSLRENYERSLQLGN
jgi:hypothetical protein